MRPTREQLHQLRDALDHALDVSTFHDFVVFRLDLDTDEVMPEGRTKRDALRDLIVAQSRAGNLATFVQEVRVFVESADAPYPTLVPLLDHLDEWLAEGEIPWAAPEDPFETFFVTGKRVFIDRDGLRQGVKGVTTGEVRVLKVLGDRPCGKSWTWFFLTYLEDKLDGFHCAKVDFADFPRPPTPYDVMKRIASRLDVGEPPRDRSNVESDQAMRLVDWFVGRISNSNAGYLVALDSLDHRRLPQSTEDLLSGLAKAAWESGESCSFALMLLGGGLELPLAGDEPGVIEEHVAPPGRDMVARYLERLAAHCGAELPGPAIEAIVTQAFEDLPADPYQALRQTTARVQKLALTYFPTVAAQ